MTDLLQIAAAGDADTLMRDLRVRSLWSPYYLTKVVLGYRELVPHLHLHDTELFIQRWLQGQRRQWIEWPRGFFKTTTFTIGCGIWIVCPVTDEDTEYALSKLKLPEEEWFARAALHDQDATQLYAFETDANSKKRVAEVRWHFEENSLFRACFPEIAYTGSEDPWNAQCLKIRRVGYGRRLEEGTFEAIGAGAALQSRHYKIVWEDDLVGKKAIESELEMQKTIRWHGLLNGAFENASTQIRFGVSNRWGYHDLNSHIRRTESEFVFYTRSAWEIGPDGREIATFPERYSIDSLLEIRKSMSPYDFSCQYLNSPQAPGENEVDEKGIHTYTVSEGGLLQCSCGKSYSPSGMFRGLHFDPYNAKGSRSCSRPALVAVGCTSDKHVFLFDYYISRGSYEAIFQQLFTMNDRWKPHIFTYEDVGAQNMVEHHIREMQRRPDFTNRRFPRIEAVGTGNKPKEIRIRDHFIPVLTRYNFSYRTSQQHFIESLRTFPHPVPDHDYDLLDALAQGALFWRFPAGEDREKEEKQENDSYLAQLGQPYSHKPGMVVI